MLLSMSLILVWCLRRLLVVANDISPSDAASIDRAVEAFATARDSAVSGKVLVSLSAGEPR